MNRFKSIVGAILVSLLMVGIASGAGSTNVVTNANGSVFQVVVNEYGKITVTTLSTPNLPASQERSRLDFVGAQLDWSGPTTTTNTLFTPRDIGDWLYGFENGTGAVWTAVGPTTNDWSAVVDP